MNKRNQIKLNNLRKAKSKLETFIQTENPSDLERTGIIKAFEYTFELFWKAFKAKAELEGLQVASPKGALRYALQAGLIKNEEVWLDMLEKRNLAVHTYNDNQAIEIYNSIKAVFAGEFETALNELTRQTVD